MEACATALAGRGGAHAALPRSCRGSPHPSPAAGCRARLAPVRAAALAPAPGRAGRRRVRAGAGPGSPGPSRPPPADEVDFAVFRFSLGIPGFDDADLPRVIAAVAGVLLVANHVASGPATGAQLRTEALGLCLTAAAAALPWVGARLNRGVGRRVGADAAGLPGARTVFAVDASLPEAARQELAWASLALLRNTNAAGLLVVRGGRALAARGALAAAPGAGAAAADGQAVLASLAPGAAAAAPLASGPLYCPDRAATAQAAAGWGFVPAGAACLVAEPLANGGLLAVWAAEPEAFSPRERAWVAAIAAKLAGALPAS